MEIILGEDNTTTESIDANGNKKMYISKTIEKKIIKTGEMTIEVSDLGREKKNIDSLLKKFKAYYDNETLSYSDYQSSEISG